MSILQLVSLLIVLIWEQTSAWDNVALGRGTHASQSGGGFLFNGADKALDGNTNSDMFNGRSCSQSDISFLGGGVAWWVVDLGQEYDIYGATIYNTNLSQERLDNTWVFATETEPAAPLSPTSSNVCNEIGRAGDVVDLVCAYNGRDPSMLRARYLLLQRKENSWDSSILHICEVQVKTCLRGTWGLGKCGNTCDGCVQGDCRLSDGFCYQGCITGHWGDRCDNSCSLCVADRCDDSTGICTLGCFPGYWGTTCNHTCSSCPSNSCRSSDGYCYQGCPTRYWGSRCEGTCKCKDDAACERATGQCDECPFNKAGSSCDLDIPEISQISVNVVRTMLTSITISFAQWNDNPRITSVEYKIMAINSIDLSEEHSLILEHIPHSIYTTATLTSLSSGTEYEILIIPTAYIDMKFYQGIKASIKVRTQEIQTTPPTTTTFISPTTTTSRSHTTTLDGSPITTDIRPSSTTTSRSPTTSDIKSPTTTSRSPTTTTSRSPTTTTDRSLTTSTSGSFIAPEAVRSNPSSDQSLTGLQIGIAVGAAFVSGLVIALAIFIVWKKRQDKQRKNERKGEKAVQKRPESGISYKTDRIDSGIYTDIEEYQRESNRYSKMDEKRTINVQKEDECSGVYIDILGMDNDGYEKLQNDGQYQKLKFLQEQNNNNSFPQTEISNEYEKVQRPLVVSYKVEPKTDQMIEQNVDEMDESKVNESVEQRVDENIEQKVDETAEETEKDYEMLKEERDSYMEPSIVTDKI